MKYFFYFFIFVLLVTALLMLVNGFATVKLKAQAVPQIAIIEIMYNPAGSDSGREWLEIFNFSTSTIYVINDQWRFNDGANHLLSAVQGNGSLATATLAVIADNPILFLQDYPDYQGILLDSSFSLNNTSDTLQLSADGGQNFFATTTYQAAWGGNNDGYTLSRVGLTDEWTASAQLGGTPGQINFPVQEEVQERIEDQAATSTPAEIESIGQATTTAEVMAITNATSSPADLGQSATSSPEDLGTSATTTNQDLSNNQISENQENNQAAENQNLSDNTTAYSSEIIINEILPNPNGNDANDEFIELFNRSNAPVSLAGWQVQDNSTRRFTVNSQNYQFAVIAAYGYFVIYSRESGVALNNDGDAVNLYQPDGNLLDAVSYFDEAESGRSFAKDAALFTWTLQPTPGQANVIKTQAISNNSGSTVVYVSQPNQQNVADEKLNVQSRLAGYDLVKYQGLRINEFLPDPVGSDSAEWVEIFNSSEAALNLGGFKLDDAEGGSKPYVFGATATIAAFEYLAIPKAVSKSFLNNDEDSVRLLSPDDEIIAEATYAKAKTGQSYNYDEINEEWFWSKNSTPGEKNFIAASVDGNETSAAASANQAEYTAGYYDFETFKQLPKGEPAAVKGIVTAAPGQLYKKSFYLSAVAAGSPVTAANQGLEVYVFDPSNLDLAIGDIVELEGNVSYVKDRARLNLGKDKKMTIVGHLGSIQPFSVSVEDLSDDLLGALVGLNGQVVKKQSYSIFLDDNGQEIRIDFKKSVKEEYKRLKEGDWLNISGIVIVAADNYRLLPRLSEDVQPAQVLGQAEDQTVLATQTINIEPNNRAQAAMKYLFYSGGGLVTILASLLIKLKFFS